MPTRLCASPGCPEPAHYRGRCHNCARAQEQRTQRAGHHVYRTKRWQVLRNRVLFEQPLCPGVYGDECGALAEHADHITPLPDGEPYARSNVQGLCAQCHGRKTKQEQATR